MLRAEGFPGSPVGFTGLFSCGRLPSLFRGGREKSGPVAGFRRRIERGHKWGFDRNSEPEEASHRGGIPRQENLKGAGVQEAVDVEPMEAGCDPLRRAREYAGTQRGATLK